MPRLDAPGGTAVVLRGHWLAAGAVPALGLMHGSSGACDRGLLPWQEVRPGVDLARACMWALNRLQESQLPND